MVREDEATTPRDRKSILAKSSHVRRGRTANTPPLLAGLPVWPDLSGRDSVRTTRMCLVLPIQRALNADNMIFTAAIHLKG